MNIMSLRWALLFFIIALIAAVFAWGDIAVGTEFAGILIFCLFMGLAVVFFISGLLNK